MKKKIVLIIIAILIILLIIAFAIDKYRMNNNMPVIFSTWGYSYIPQIPTISLSNESETEVAGNEAEDEAGYDAYSKIEKEDILQNGGGIIDWAINISDNNVVYNKSDYIIIGKVQTIDGGTNYNPREKVYTLPETIGKITVERVLKGQLDEKIIPYIRLDGIVTVAEYQKSLFKEEYQSKNHWINKLSEEEKNNKYVKELTYENIDIEQDKTYLMYMNYTADYERYAIGFVQYGLREVDTTTLGLDNKTIKVKNNDTGKWETLDKIIPNL